MTSKHYASVAIVLLSIAAIGSTPARQTKPLRFEISFPAALRAAAVDGRLLLMISTNADKEPRFQIGGGIDTQQIFGIDVDGLAPGQTAVIGESTTGYPRESLRDVPDGDFLVQALLNIYETFHRADGHVVKLPMDDGEGQHWNTSREICSASRGRCASPARPPP